MDRARSMSAEAGVLTRFGIGRQTRIHACDLGDLVLRLRRNR
jgi:hypothetical protein